ncbi:MAG: sulfite exporter TauE/SafE family protein, partial [Actinobacteria bacterium]|nr:sulfite exporter TauE/SafE family protein [Actinomycetota bacterium]
MTAALIVALAVGIVFAAAVVRGYSGFGFAMIGVAGISLTAPPD